MSKLAKGKLAFILVPLVGYVGLWILGSILFLAYFSIFKVQMDSNYGAMIERVPVLLAVITVPLCSFASFFAATKFMLRKSGAVLDVVRIRQVAVISLLVTIGLDLLITVGLERTDILAFPVNLMYLFAWLVIVPSVILAGHQKRN